MERKHGFFGRAWNWYFVLFSVDISFDREFIFYTPLVADGFILLSCTHSYMWRNGETLKCYTSRIMDGLETRQMRLAMYWSIDAFFFSFWTMQNSSSSPANVSSDCQNRNIWQQSLQVSSFIFPRHCVHQGCTGVVQLEPRCNWDFAWFSIPRFCYV